jgi:preprotein translocase subunit YajC
MVLLIPFFILAAFFLMRANPQRRRVQAQRAMLDHLQPGTRVVTVAGIIGTIVGVEGDRAAIEVAPGVIVEFLVAAIVRVDEPTAEPGASVTDFDDDATGTDLDAPDDDATAPRHEET